MGATAVALPSSTTSPFAIPLHPCSFPLHPVPLTCGAPRRLLACVSAMAAFVPPAVASSRGVGGRSSRVAATGGAPPRLPLRSPRRGAAAKPMVSPICMAGKKGRGGGGRGAGGAGGGPGGPGGGAATAAAAVTAPSSSGGSLAGERLLWAESVSLSHDGDRQQFREVSITLQRGRKVGLVGPNGTGKSSLLKVLAGEIPPDEGTVTLRKGASLALVEQEPHLPPDTLVLDAVLDTAERVSSNAPDVLAVVEYNRALAAFEAAPDDPTVAKRVERAAERMETLHAWDTDAFVKTAISRLGLGDTDESYKRRVGDLSGGQRKRVALAAALTARADVVLCDEPTNHLSVEAIAWLEETLREPGLTVACVTHDRAFLDGVCDEIVELDRGKVHFHGPGYEAFLESKAARLSSAAKSAEVDRQRLKKELAWMRKQPKARGTKSRARVDSFFELQESVRVASRVSNTVDGLKTTVSRMGDKVLTLDAATLTRGDVVVLDGVSYEFQKGEKVGVVGDNGVGKVRSRSVCSPGAGFAGFETLSVLRATWCRPGAPRLGRRVVDRLSECCMHSLDAAARLLPRVAATFLPSVVLAVCSALFSSCLVINVPCVTVACSAPLLVLMARRAHRLCIISPRVRAVLLPQGSLRGAAARLG